MTESTPDLGLTLPLHGLQLVEASAGTGKTFTLATLYARLVIELRLPVASLLAVTFTDAATKELRTRIRERLQLAARIAEGEPVGGNHADEVLTRSLVEAALVRESAAALRLRLRQAAEQMDLAPVYTIHGFCRRALADHALEAGHAPGDVELVQNERALREEVATDLWRLACQDEDDARALMALWVSPSDMAQSLRDLVNVDTLLPEPAPFDGEAARRNHALFETAGVAVALAWPEWAAETAAALRALQADGAISGTTHGDKSTGPGWQALESWAQAGGTGQPEDKRVALFATRKLASAINKRFQGKVTAPANALTDAIERWVELRDQVALDEDERRIRLVHQLRHDAAEQLARLKRDRRLQGFDDLIRGLATALAGEHGARLAERLRAQYRVALLDEFQDTDPQQWEIFRRVFAQATDDGGPRALFLIGDPKQAIYRFRGGDVFTYLDAAKQADGGDTLTRNFRSRPLALQAVQALYAGAGPTPFGQDGIPFIEVAAGGNVADDALMFGDAVAPALNLLLLPDAAEGTYRADDGRAAAAIACVAAIRDLLSKGYASCRDQKQMRAVRPGDIAVLVQSHHQSRLIQRTLARAGVPFVAQGRDSLYASAEAQDLLTLLEACLHLADDSRLRGALATPLIGLDATALAALDDDGPSHRLWQDRALGWRTRWERHGALALVTDLCAGSAPRLLALDDGERRLTNWLQLAESLQSAGAGHDAPAVLALLRQRMADADADNDEELMRLESDAARVKVMTLHKSKGLEFPIVMLPFLSEAGGSGARGRLSLAKFHDGIRRVARFKAGDPALYTQASDRDKAETRAEKRRLLYVGLTRARLATWACFGATKTATDTPLADLLYGDPRNVKPKAFTASLLGERLSALALSAPGAIAVTDAAVALPLGAPAAEPLPVLPPAVTPVRHFGRDWWVHSFSGLAREAGGAEERRAADESEPLLPASRFAGARFGNVLHEALEEVDFAAWKDAGEVPPAGQSAPLEHALRNGGYSTPHDLAEGVPLLTRLVRDTLNVTLPEGVRLCDLPAAQRRPEMEFHFLLAPARVDALLALMHAHGLVSARQTFGKRERLEGLMTGFIDLVYEHAGRYYVLDYKSNQLPDYGPDALADAVAHSEYDLQYLLYTLALHRWLRFRLPGYDYGRHFGGVRYLFCRGLDAAHPDSPGIHANTPPQALVDALDALLLPAAKEAA